MNNPCPSCVEFHAVCPCPSCVEFHADNPNSPIQEGVIKDEVTGALLCKECYDFYYTDDFNRHIAGDR